MTSTDTLPPPVRAAVRMAAESHDLTVEQVELLGFQRVEWSDSSLGCPEKDMFYAQVIVPGYLIRVEVAGEMMEYHTDDSNRVVSCGVSN